MSSPILLEWLLLEQQRKLAHFLFKVFLGHCNQTGVSGDLLWFSGLGDFCSLKTPKCITSSWRIPCRRGSSLCPRRGQLPPSSSATASAAPSEARTNSLISARRYIKMTATTPIRQQGALISAPRENKERKWLCTSIQYERRGRLYFILLLRSHRA